MNKIISLSYEDIKRMRITRINADKATIRFKIGDDKYQIEQWPSYIYDLHKRDRVADIVLSKYNRDNNTYEELYRMATKSCLLHMISDISKRVPKSRHTNYSNVDKMYFVKMLTDIGMLDGYFKELCKINKREQEDFDDRISELEEQISKLKQAKENMYNKRMGTTGHGSKIYGQSFKGKISDRIVGSGYKNGEYVERVHAKIGDTHPEYDGVLTDLRNLPYGTYIHCTNGDWYAVVSCDNHGDKTLDVQGEECSKSVRIREDNCLIYIDNLEDAEE